MTTFSNILMVPWDASVQDPGSTPELLDEIKQEVDDSLLQDSIFDEFGDLQQ